MALHTVTKISILFMLSVALASAQLDWPRAGYGLRGAEGPWGWAGPKAGFWGAKAGGLYDRERMFAYGRPRFVDPRFSDPRVADPRLADPRLDAFTHDEWARRGLGMGMVGHAGFGFRGPWDSRAFGGDHRPLVVYSNGERMNAWGARGLGLGPADPSVSAIIRAPSARLLPTGPEGKPTVLVSGPLGPRVVPKPIDEAVLEGPPKPYAFGFDTQDEFNNKMTRHEEKDETGRVTGSYSYQDANGQTRMVNYVADEAGFRADVKTNEHGTQTSSPAAAVIESAAPDTPPPMAPHPTQMGPMAAPVAPITPRGYERYPFRPVSGMFGGPWDGPGPRDLGYYKKAAKA